MYLVYYNDTSYNVIDILTTKVFIPVEQNKDLKCFTFSGWFFEKSSYSEQCCIGKGLQIQSCI